MSVHPTSAEQAPALSGFRRITVKIGSALLVEDGSVRADWLDGLVSDLAVLTASGTEVVVVSSGAIALGRARLGLGDRPLRLEESQAAAAAGQIALARTWEATLSAHGMKAAQVLLTLGDTEQRRRYLNARSTIATLLRLGAVPIINENDTVATTEIRYGDNDRLAARVAAMASCDGLVLLSDIDGLYTAPPATHTEAHHIPRVDAITAEIEAMAGDAGSALSRGGMRTKLEAAKIALGAGCTMLIASGRISNPLSALSSGARSTWFPASASPRAAWRSWIAGQVAPQGALVIDLGAVEALARGKSLLPAGVRAVEGAFKRGDAVTIRSLDGAEIGRGLVAYDAPEARAIAGLRTEDIAERLGYEGRAAMIHRDEMALLGPSAVYAREGER